MILKRLPFALAFLLFCSVANAAEEECEPAGALSFICGPQSPEDLVLVPDTSWIIASGMVPGASIYLIDAQQKTWSKLYPADAPRAVQDMATYGACPGSPDPNSLVTHGLNIRRGADGHSTLYVVGHGGREAIEVFDVDANGEQTGLTSTGCVMLPEGMVANSVASPADAGFTMVQGTELPYGNGIEVSADGSEFFVASSGDFTVIAYSNSNPARKLRVTKELELVPDNLHMGSDGRLITGGLLTENSECGSVRSPEVFDLEAFASCPRPFVVQAIDPQTMEPTDLARGPANPRFSNITMGLPVGDEIWIGTFAGDRVGYQ